MARVTVREPVTAKATVAGRRGPLLWRFVPLAFYLLAFSLIRGDLARLPGSVAELPSGAPDVTAPDGGYRPGNRPRRARPCATCAGEMGHPGQLQYVTALRPEQYQLQSIELVGQTKPRPVCSWDTSSWDA